MDVAPHLGAEHPSLRPDGRRVVGCLTGGPPAPRPVAIARSADFGGRWAIATGRGAEARLPPGSVIARCGGRANTNDLRVACLIGLTSWRGRADAFHTRLTGRRDVEWASASACLGHCGSRLTAWSWSRPPRSPPYSSRWRCPPNRSASSISPARCCTCRPGASTRGSSRLHRLLGLATPLHRVPVARSGLVQLDREAVSIDADRFRTLVAEAESLIEAGNEDDALPVLLRADDLWRAVRRRGRNSATRMRGRRSVRPVTSSPNDGGTSASSPAASASSAQAASPRTGCSDGLGRGRRHRRCGTRGS